MTRMMKIVPARRLVTEALLEPPTRPPSTDRSRAMTPAGRTVADGASVAATARNPQGCRRGAAIIGLINDSLTFGWVRLAFGRCGHAKHKPESRCVTKRQDFLLQID